MIDLLLQKVGLNGKTLTMAKNAYAIAQKYPKTKQGAMQALRDVGGKATLNAGITFFEQNPKIKSVCEKMGIDTGALRGIANDILKNEQSSPAQVPTNDLQDRLNKLR